MKRLLRNFSEKKIIFPIKIKCNNFFTQIFFPEDTKQSCKITEIPGVGRGVWQAAPWMEIPGRWGVWIFFGTTHYSWQLQSPLFTVETNMNLTDQTVMRSCYKPGKILSKARWEERTDALGKRSLCILVAVIRPQSLLSASSGNYFTRSVARSRDGLIAHFINKYDSPYQL